MKKTYDEKNETQNVIDNAEECLRRLINTAAQGADLRIVVERGCNLPAVIDTGASDFDSVVGFVDFCKTAEVGDDGEEFFPADDIGALKRAWEAQGFPADLVGDEDIGECVFFTFPRAFWNQAFRKFGFPEYDEQIFDRMW